MKIFVIQIYYMYNVLHLLPEKNLRFKKTWSMNPRITTEIKTATKTNRMINFSGLPLQP